MHDLIVIGAGPGGYEAAAHAGAMGKKVALIEEQWIGGACLNVGCIPAKAFLQSSRRFRECKEAETFGVHIAGAKFDAPLVVDRKNRIVATLARGVEALLTRSGVEVITGHARLSSRNRVAVGTDILETQNILIATGSRPALPSIPGIDSDQVLDSNRVFDARDIPTSVAIIGGGYIGLELATFYAEVGAAVTAFEKLPEIAAGCDADVSARLLQALKRSGITFKLSCAVLAVEGDGIRYRETSGEEQRHATDRVINATGRTPVVEDLGLEGIGIDFSVKGIRITEDGMTNIPGVWACGDVTGQHMLAHVATREGIVAVNSMFGRRDRTRYDTMPAVIYTHPEVAMAGRTEQDLQRAGIDYRKATVQMGVAGRFLIENEHGSGFVKVLAAARSGEILGVHAVGDTSGEFIIAAGTLIETGVTAKRAAEIVFPHPTVSEALHAAIVQIAQEYEP